MTYLLIRHGLSEHNMAGILAGSKLNTSLTSQGVIDTKKFATQLITKHQISSIVCSNLKRSKQTASIFQQTLKLKTNRQVAIQSTKLLNEVDVGSLTGLNHDQARHQFPNQMQAIENHSLNLLDFPHGESYADLINRYNLLTNWIANIQSETILVVGHGMFNQIILEQTNHRPFHYQHSSITIFNSLK